MKDVVIGIVYAALGIIGIVAIASFSSPAVTGFAGGIGVIAFFTLFMYGAQRAVTATLLPTEQ